MYDGPVKSRTSDTHKEYYFICKNRPQKTFPVLITREEEKSKNLNWLSNIALATFNAKPDNGDLKILEDFELFIGGTFTKNSNRVLEYYSD